MIWRRNLKSSKKKINNLKKKSIFINFFIFIYLAQWFFHFFFFNLYLYNLFQVLFRAHWISILFNYYRLPILELMSITVILKYFEKKIILIEYIIEINKNYPPSSNATSPPISKLYAPTWISWFWSIRWPLLPSLFLI